MKLYNYNKKSKIFELYWKWSLFLMVRLAPRMDSKHFISIRIKIFFIMDKIAWFLRKKLAYYYG